MQHTHTCTCSCEGAIGRSKTFTRQVRVSDAVGKKPSGAPLATRMRTMTPGSTNALRIIRATAGVSYGLLGRAAVAQLLHGVETLGSFA